MGIESILAVLGLVVPPVTDFIKKKWLNKESDTTEATASSLATTKPEQVAPYMEAMSKWYDTLTRWFNRDVIGTPSQWVIDIRASIRPIAVVLSILIIAIDGFWTMGLTPEVRGAMMMNITSWFGDRMAK